MVTFSPNPPADAVEARSGVTALMLITSLFFFWGIANALNDILIPQFKKSFELTDLESGFVQSAFYAGYFLFAIPAAAVMQRSRYKFAIVLGLPLFALGAFAFYPAAVLFGMPRSSRRCSFSRRDSPFSKPQPTR